MPEVSSWKLFRQLRGGCKGVTRNTQSPFTEFGDTREWRFLKRLFCLNP